MGFRVDVAKGLTERQEQRANQSFNRLDSLYQMGKTRAYCHFEYSTNIVINHRLVFGQNLYLRGEGFSVIVNNQKQEANWSRGIALKNIGENTWEAQVSLNKTDAVFKALINDEIWEEGDNHPCSDFFKLMEPRHQFVSMSISTSTNW